MTKDYKVGYGRPPVGGRFRPGQSGNPAGRKKGSKNLASIIQAALDEKVVINTGGKRRSISKLEAAFIQQSNKAAGGDPKATKLMMDFLLAAKGRDAASQVENVSGETRAKINAKLVAGLVSRFSMENDDGLEDR